MPFSRLTRSGLRCPPTSQRIERQMEKQRPLPCGLVGEKQVHDLRQILGEIPHPVSAIEIFHEALAE